MFHTKVVQKIKTYIFTLNNIFFEKKHAVFWENVKNMVQPDRPRTENNTMPEKMRLARRINEARI